jgi:hypothetical protein
MKTSIASVLCLGIVTASVTSALAAPPPALTPAAAPVAAASAQRPSLQYTLSLGKPAAAPADTASTDPFFTASDAVAKARTQVEKELAVLGTSSSSSPGRSLVIPREGTDAKALSDMEEDLSVMGHIIDKAASSKDEKSARAMGIYVHTPLGSALPRNLYLDGYGALFFLNVNFPLVPPPNKKEETQPKEETSTEWEDAKRELFQPSSYAGDLPKLFTMEQGSGSFAFSTGGQTEDYDADKVDELKRNLVTSLKNAVHIRKLKSDETVTIIVNGHSPETRIPRRASSNSRPANVWTMKTASDTKGTRLIVRAKKSDIEAFQKDKTSLDDFRQKVTIMTY